MPPTPTAVPTRNERLYDRASLAVVLLLVVIAGFTFRDYGVTWDEAYHITYGYHINRFYGSGFTDHSALTYRIDYLYGGGFDATATIFRWWVRAFAGKFEAVHLYGSMIGILGVAGTGRLGRVLGGPRVGFLATVMMATTSVYYGHMFNNPKDLPFAAGYAWGLYFLFRLIAHFPRIPRDLAIKAAIAIGLAMSVRIGGLLLVCYLGFAIVVWIVHHAWLRRSAEWGYHAARRIVPACIGIVAGAWVVMLAWWPWALFDPVKRPLAALRRMGEFIDHRRYMPFAGREVYNIDPPWDYLIHYFGLQLPEYVVVLLVFASAFGLTLAFTDTFRRLPFYQRLSLVILAMSIWFPPVYATAKGSPLYDGYRHFLFILPPMMACGALVIDAVMKVARSRWGARGLVIAWVVFGVLVGDQVATMVRLHPQQYVYFNRFIGGVGGAVGVYDTDYYAQTYKESAEKLHQELWKQERETYLETVYSVGGCIGETRAMLYLPANFRWHGEEKTFDFDIGYTRGSCDQKHPESPIITRVERDGGTLNVARDLRKVIVDSKEHTELLRLKRKTDEKAKKSKRPKKPKKSKSAKPRSRTDATAEPSDAPEPP
jgi:hypothetical protein